MINKWDMPHTDNPYKQRLLKIINQVVSADIEQQVEMAKSLCQKNQSVYDDIYYIIDETDGKENSQLHVYCPMELNDIEMFNGNPKYPHLQYHISQLDGICSILILDRNSIVDN